MLFLFKAMPNQRKASQTTATITIPKHLIAWVKKEAESRGQSTSEYIRCLLLKKWDDQIPKK
jgi:predicted DNA binding CopG/RHH family protein